MAGRNHSCCGMVLIPAIVSARRWLPSDALPFWEAQVEIEKLHSFALRTSVHVERKYPFSHIGQSPNTRCQAPFRPPVRIGNCPSDLGVRCDSTISSGNVEFDPVAPNIQSLTCHLPQAVGASRLVKAVRPALATKTEAGGYELVQSMVDLMGLAAGPGTRPSTVAHHSEKSDALDGTPERSRQRADFLTTAARARC